MCLNSFNDSTKAAEAAKSLRMDAISLKSLGIIDEIIKEPLGGAHRNFEETAQNMKEMVVKEFKRIDKFSLRELLKEDMINIEKLVNFLKNKNLNNYFGYHKYW